MTTDIDTTRIVRSWLHEDAHESADRLLVEVVAALDTTPQHRTRWPTWRVGPMNVDVKLGLYAAAVLAVVALVMNLLPGQAAPPAGAPAVSPLPSPSLTPSASPDAEVWPTGAYGIGRHAATLEGVPFTFDVARDGWRSSNWTGMLETGMFPQEDYAWIGFTWSFDKVATDGCAHTARTVGPSVDDLATALTTIPGTEALEPVDTAVGGLPAKVVEFTINDDLPCAPTNFILYGDSSAYPNSTDSTIRDWVFEVDGNRTGIHVDQIGTNQELEQEIEDIIASVEFGQDEASPSRSGP